MNVVASGSVVLPGLSQNADPANPGPIDTWQYAQTQRLEVLQLLTDLVPRRFLLLSGDYHVSAAVEIHGNGGILGAAIVAPPIYAPLPYANASPGAIDIAETVTLASDRLRLVVPKDGEQRRGSGFGCIGVRERDGGYEITYERDLWVWESGTPSTPRAVITL